MVRLRQYCNSEQALAPRRLPTLAVLCLVSGAVLAAAGTFSPTQAQRPQLQNIDLSFEQPIYLKASNTGAGDKFGIVAISGDTLVVSAREKNSSAGSVYVFVRDGTTWSQQAYLRASNTDPGDLFGWSVAISGDTLVVGAQGEERYIGAAYVFTRSGTQWSQQAYLKASPSPGTDAAFGSSVAISGDTVVVGAANAYGGFGAAYVFARSGTTWSQQADLTDIGVCDNFGQSVAVSGDTVVVGSLWAEAHFGQSVAVSGDTVVVGSHWAEAAYVFTRNGTVWSQQTCLRASNTAFGDNFGVSVDLSDDTLVVGAWEEDSSATGINGDQSNNSADRAGAAYVFTRSGTVWSQQAYLKASNTGPSDFFGRWVRMFDDTLVVGANHEASNATGINGDQSNNSVPSAGAAYVFTRNGTVWSQQAYLKASSTGVDDRFGRYISDDTIVVGAFLEDSNATGINGDSDDNSMPDAGAVYVFPYLSEAPDDDSDGVDDSIENEAPNGGDANNDGTADSEQAHVASLPNAVTGEYVSLISAQGTSLVSVQAVENPSPMDLPPGVVFPLGLFEFSAQGLDPGTATSVELLLPDGLEIDTYYKFGPTPGNGTDHWYDFVWDDLTGVEVSEGKLDLHFIDGSRGDDDLSANGTVVEPGGPAQLLGSFFFPQFADGSIANIQLLCTLVLANAGADSAVQVEFFSSPDGEPMGADPGRAGNRLPF